ncbi:MAG: lysozyme inhibitor LprI family protein [Candidatus Pacebacteria bacterium]|nr:lysozyme inhibitor LprI family protein [Candidatus Paceibacterota bacterium]
MKKILLSLLIGAFGLSGVVHAKYSTYSECDYSLATFDMFDCIDEEYSRQDAKLNKAYKRAMAELNKDKVKQKELKELQRIWINYRDAKCNYNYGLTGGGTFDREVVKRCFVIETVQRAKEL